jgi:hypothetical protein
VLEEIKILRTFTDITIVLMAFCTDNKQNGGLHGQQTKWWFARTTNKMAVCTDNKPNEIIMREDVEENFKMSLNLPKLY